MLVIQSRLELRTTATIAHLVALAGAHSSHTNDARLRVTSRMLQVMPTSSAGRGVMHSSLSIGALRPDGRLDVRLTSSSVRLTFDEVNE
eukprot:5863102-Prymnesium_polylepis.2